MGVYFFLAGYFIVATLVAVWVLGVIHAYEVNEFPCLNNKPPYLMAASAYLLILPAVVSTSLTYIGHGWLWPKRGVTYDKERSDDAD